MNQIYKMALRYYPDRWNDTMLRNLVELGRLTKQAHDNMPPYLAVYTWKRTA